MRIFLRTHIFLILSILLTSSLLVCSQIYAENPKKKLTFLFFGFPAHGHTNQTLSLIKSLTDRGHSVTYVSKEPFRRKIQEAGATFLDYKSESLDALLSGKYSSSEFLKAILLSAAEIIPNFFKPDATNQFDAVIYDKVSGIWGQIYADKFKLPTICSSSTFLFTNEDAVKYMPEFMPNLKDWKEYEDALHSVKETYDKSLIEINDVLDLIHCHRSDRVLAYTSSLLQPNSEKFKGEKYIYLGNRLEPTQHVQIEKLKEGSLIFISLGTVFNSDSKLLRILINYFSPKYKILVSTGGNRVTYEKLQDLISPNVEIYENVNQKMILREKASVFVSHGGINSLYEGVFYQVPTLMLPQMGEQLFNSLRIQKLKAGYIIDKSNIEQSLQRQFTKLKFRWKETKYSLEKIKLSFLKSDSPQSAASRIERFLILHRK